MEDLARIEQDGACQERQRAAAGDLLSRLDRDVPLAADTTATPGRFHASNGTQGV